MELPDEEGGCKGWKVLRKIVLADSEGVIVAAVMFETTERVSSSSSRSSTGDVLDVEYEGDRGAGCGPLLSFYLSA